MSHANATLSNCIDDFVEAYESSRELGKQKSLLDFLPDKEHESYQLIASELIRVDMEYSWSEGHAKRLSDYQELLPNAFDDKALFEQVAFEEYRLRCQSGEKVSPREYRENYEIETAAWPRFDLDTSKTSSSQDRVAAQDSSFNQLWQEAHELVDDVQGFPAVGDCFSGFQLQKELGRGAFARVFLARQGELSDRPVVLKVASGHSLEPQHLARLQHTNIVPIYSVHHDGNLTAVCMPYFGDRTLADLIAAVQDLSDTIGSSQQNLISTFLERGDPTKLMNESSTSEGIPLPRTPSSKVITALAEKSYVDAVVWLMKQLAEGVAHAHRRGIIHRDLKPANVLLTDEGLPTILDFNLSEDIVVHGRACLLVGGTLPYMSPEHLQAVSREGRVGPQTDVFSLGVIFYELLTGRRPYPEHRGAFDDVVHAMIADRMQGAVPVLSRNPSVPPSIDSVVRKCLATDVHRRYQSADELAEDLSLHLRHQPLRYATDKSVVERSKKWLRRHPKLSSGGGVAAIAGVILLVGFGLWLLRGQRLARIEAEQAFDLFRQQQPSLSMALGVRFAEPEILVDGTASAMNALEKYGILDDNEWRNRSVYKPLNRADRERLDLRLAEMLFLLAKAKEELSHAETEPRKRAELLDTALTMNRQAMDTFAKETCPAALFTQRATLLSLQGETDIVDELLQQAESQPSDNVIDQYSDVYDLIGTRDYLAAKALLIELRDRSPNDPMPWLMLGDAHAALGNYSDSEGCLEAAIALQPDSYAALLQRGLCRMQLEKFVDALDDFESMTSLRPDLACGYLNRALAHQALDNREEAIADLTQALDLGATQTRIYFLRSRLRRLTGDQDGAEKDLAIGMENTPSDEESWISRGFARRKTDPSGALSDFRHALQLNPVSISALRNIVHILADQLYQPQEAMETLNQILAINENDDKAIAGRAVLHAREGNREAAVADIERLLKSSKRPVALFQAACALSLTSNQQETDLGRAMILLSRAIQLEPSWLARAQSDPDLESLRQTDSYQKFVGNFIELNSLNMNLNKKKHVAPGADTTDIEDNN